VRPEATQSVLTCPLGPRDRIVADDIKAACGIDTDANLVRSALYHFAVFTLGRAAVDTRSFRVRAQRGRPFVCSSGRTSA